MRYLVFFVIYGSFVSLWNGFPYPHFNYETVYTTKGLVKCEGGPSNKANGGTYVVDGDKYVGRFSRLFGFTGTSCSQDLIGKMVEIQWIKSEDPIARVMLQIADSDTGVIYGNSSRVNLNLLKYDETDTSWIWFVKVFVGIFGTLLIRNFKLRRSNGKSS